MYTHAVPSCCSARVIAGLDKIKGITVTENAQNIFNYLTSGNGSPSTTYAFDVIFINQLQKEDMGAIGVKAFTKAGFQQIGTGSNGNHNRAVYCFVRMNNPMTNGVTDYNYNRGLKWDVSVKESDKKAPLKRVRKVVRKRIIKSVKRVF